MSVGDISSVVICHGSLPTKKESMISRVSRTLGVSGSRSSTSTKWNVGPGWSALSRGCQKRARGEAVDGGVDGSGRGNGRMRSGKACGRESVARQTEKQGTTALVGRIKIQCNQAGQQTDDRLTSKLLTREAGWTMAMERKKSEIKSIDR